ncbi:MAG: TIGR01459 family HAD-type hydrolase [Aliidongia sp.]
MTLVGPNPPALLDGIAAIADRYDGFVLDVWGVLHNGMAPYPGVVDALQRLHAAGKRVVLLSNAPMRAEKVAARIEKLGVPRPLFQAVMTSGEEVWLNLLHRTDPLYAVLGRHCLFIGSPRHRGMLEGIGLVEAATPEEADFILDTGPDDLDDEATGYRAVLEESAARGLPMLCANADLHVMHGDTLIACAGQLAKIYEDLGGAVRWHGKPHGSVYAACLDLLGIADRSRILCVGDSLRTDIAGANAAGLDSMLVGGGIHAAELGLLDGAPLDPAKVAALLQDRPMPRYVIGELSW